MHSNNYSKPHHFISSSYIPTGITYLGDALYVLYIKIGSSASAWRIVPSQANLQSVQSTVQPFIDEGYLPTGITSFGDEYLTLLLLIPDSPATEWGIESYQVGHHGSYINESIEKGYYPWGLRFRGDTIDMLYVAF